jgi:hypothetical protein
MAIDVFIQPPLEKINIKATDGADLNDLLAGIDHFNQHRQEGEAVAGVRRDGEVLAWVEAVSGPAPGGLTYQPDQATAVARGELVANSADDWEGPIPRALKQGAQTLLDQYGS